MRYGTGLRAALAIICLAVAAAHAEGKRPVIVLELAAKDDASTKPAAAITAALRAEAGAKASDYRVVATPAQIAKASDAADCLLVDPSCAAKIGQALGAELVISGELERRSTHQTLVLWTVDVRAKQRVRSARQTGAAGADAKLARAAYARLVAEEVGGLAILANAQTGEVVIDGQVVAGLFEGHATIERLGTGTHLLAIRAKGYRPFELEITIETTTRSKMLLLEHE